VFQAFVLDADNNAVGESEKVTIKVNSATPEYKGIKIDPTGIMDPETPINVEVYASQGLSSVKVIINDVLTALDEDTPGTYKGKIYSPADAGTYGISTMLSDEFGHETKKDNVAQITVRAPELKSASSTGVVETITTPATPLDQQTELNLNITGIKVTELKERSIITWDPVKDAVSYNVYKKIDDNKVELLENVTEPRFEVPITGKEIKYDYFAIKALGKTSSGETVPGDLSDMTKVKTGPGLYILFAILALVIAGSGMYLRRKQA